MTPEEILDNGWKGYRTLDEINAALDFAEQHPWLIDWDRYKPDPEEVWHRDRISLLLREHASGNG